MPVSLFPDLVEKNNHNDTSKENYKANVSDGLKEQRMKLVFVGGRRSKHCIRVPLEKGGRNQPHLGLVPPLVIPFRVFTEVS